ncbi:MAG: ArsR/SmtB family transcription factor [Candidatus Heimdallarchaeota archaeon]
MESPHESFCCPKDPEVEGKWIARLEREKERVFDRSGEQMAEQELLLKSLSHPIRLNILYYLLEKPNCVCELVRKLKEANSKVSYHLSYLTQSQLIASVNRSGNVYYRINRQGRTVMDWLGNIPIAKEK